MHSELIALRPSACLLSLFLAVATAKAESEKESPFPADSPEHQALTVASPFLGEEAFSLRQDYWNGTLTSFTGTALKLQFFKGNTYRLFFGATPSALAPGATLHLVLLNAENEEVAAVTGEPGAPAVALHLEGAPKTGLYLAVMRVETPPGPLAETEIPAVLFYGWK